MLSFHGDKKIKEKYLHRIRAHAAADEIVQGIGWEDGRGCAVGCTLDAYDHSLYPYALGIPEWMGQLEDAIHEGLPLSAAKLWPERFLAAVPVGIDLNPVRHVIAVKRMDRLISQQSAQVGKYSTDVNKAIGQCISALESVRTYHLAQGRLDLAVRRAESAAAELAAKFVQLVQSSESMLSAAWLATFSARSAAHSAEFAALSAESMLAAAWVIESDELIATLESLT